MYLMPFGRRNDSMMNLLDQMERSFWKDTGSSFSSFPTDIKDEGDHFSLTAELPGFKKEDIHLSLHDGVLTISAKHEDKKEEKEEKEEKDEHGNYLCRERHYGSYQRSFSVSGIQEENITARYESGVLHLNLPKEAPQVPVARQIEIQ